MRPTQLLRAVTDRMPIDHHDVFQLAGAAVVAWGVGLIYQPAGVIVAGLELFALGLLGDLAKGKEHS